MRINVATPKDVILGVLEAPSLSKADPEKLSAAMELLLDVVRLSGGETPDPTGEDVRDVQGLCKVINLTLISAKQPYSKEMEKFIVAVVNFKSRLGDRIKGIDFYRNLTKSIEDVFKAKELKIEALDERLKSHIETSVAAFRRDCETIQDVEVADFKEHLSIISGAGLYDAARAIFKNIHDRIPQSQDDVDEMAQRMFDIVSSVGDKLGYKLPQEKAYDYRGSWIDEFKHQYKCSMGEL